MNTNELINKVNQIKKAGRDSKTYMSNSFYNFAAEDSEKEWDVMEGSKTLWVKLHEPGVERLLFFAADYEELVTTSESLQGEYTLEIVSRDNKLYSEVLSKMKFEQLAEMYRISNTDITNYLEEMLEKYPGDDISCDAGRQDVDEIYELLWKTFDTRISHLPDRLHLEKLIEETEFRIIRDDSCKVVMLNQAVIEPKRYYFNQIVNLYESKGLHICLCNSLKRYHETGGRYVYAWVESNNIPSLKCFGKYGMKPDGLFTSVYIKN